jgi:DNA-binding NtrC family response regulator
MRPEVLQSVAIAVAEAHSVESVLGGITQGLGAEGDIALARIWLIEPGDICSSCPMRADILGEGGRIRLDLALPTNRGRSEATEPRAPAPSPTTGVVTSEEMRRRERQNILAALEEARGKLYGRGGAATLLSIKATTLASRMKALGIKRPRA